MIDPLYILKTKQQKMRVLFDYTIEDSFFAPILHEFNDFGHEIGFSLFGAGGVYTPNALSTEPLDTPEKKQAFARGFNSMNEQGNMRAKMQFCVRFGRDMNTHYFLHELMHFYQDMHGLYLTPLHEQGIFPIMLDAKGFITATLFCEAWAQTEAIRTSWSLRKKGYPQGWRGAMKSIDWRSIALAYDTDLQGGMDEKCAAAVTFERWYQGKHRAFYERKALKSYKEMLDKFRANNFEAKDIAQNFRYLDLPLLIARLPKGGIPKYFSLIDWPSDDYHGPENQDVATNVNEIKARYGAADNPNIQEIKCGAPPYLWLRLRAGGEALSKDKF